MDGNCFVKRYFHLGSRRPTLHSSFIFFLLTRLCHLRITGPPPSPSIEYITMKNSSRYHHQVVIFAVVPWLLFLPPLGSATAFVGPARILPYQQAYLQRSRRQSLRLAVSIKGRVTTNLQVRHHDASEPRSHQSGQESHILRDKPPAYLNTDETSSSR